MFRADDPAVVGLASRRDGRRLTGRLPLAITPIHANPRIVAKREVSISGITESLVFPELSGLCREIHADFWGR